MTPTELIDTVIADLEAAKADATKVEAGKAGAPGTRVRKAAGKAQDDLQALKKLIISLRNSE